MVPLQLQPAPQENDMVSDIQPFQYSIKQWKCGTRARQSLAEVCGCFNPPRLNEFNFTCGYVNINFRWKKFRFLPQEARSVPHCPLRSKRNTIIKLRINTVCVSLTNPVSLHVMMEVIKSEMFSGKDQTSSTCIRSILLLRCGSAEEFCWMWVTIISLSCSSYVSCHPFWYCRCTPTLVTDFF
jgi:hypothetical protein